MGALPNHDFHLHPYAGSGLGNDTYLNLAESSPSVYYPLGSSLAGVLPSIPNQQH